MQNNEEKGAERCMDDYLKSIGLHRKKIAKDGSCLFRAVAEQVRHDVKFNKRQMSAPPVKSDLKQVFSNQQQLSALKLCLSNRLKRQISLLLSCCGNFLDSEFPKQASVLE